LTSWKKSELRRLKIMDVKYYHIVEDVMNDCGPNGKDLPWPCSAELKMKRYLTVIVLLCVAALVTQRRTEGAHFSYYAGGFSTFCEVDTEDSTSSDGPYSDANDDTSFATVEEYAEVAEAYGYAYNDIWSYAEDDSICIQTQSVADAIADNDTAFASGWGYGRTEDPQTYGIYYTIMPDEGEEMGDNVMVYYSDIISIAAEGSTFAYIGGPEDMNHMAITRGQLPTGLTEPNSEYEVLTWPNLELSDEGGYWFSGVHMFDAKIGDVIGIFVENYTYISGWGPLDGVVENGLWIVLTVRTVLTGDLDSDGDVDLNDFAKLAENWLAGTAPPQAHAMQAESSRVNTSPAALKRYGGTKVPMRFYESNGPDEGSRRTGTQINGSRTVNHRVAPADTARRR
jgi:hypothetical protein